jgi:hypothetical protein
VVPDSSWQLAEYVRDFVADPPWLPLQGLVEPGDRPTERIAFDRGLSDEEFSDIETRLKFVFPPDLRLLLSVGLPVSRGFPDWRSAAAEDRDRILGWPAHGGYLDVERTGFWLASWGPRPTDLDAALTIAGEHIAQAPTLIPIFGHRYIAAEPAASGNPVFSVYGTGIIFYGRDLRDYLEREFRHSEDRNPVAGQHRVIRFWSDIVT